MKLRTNDELASRMVEKFNDALFTSLTCFNSVSNLEKWSNESHRPLTAIGKMGARAVWTPRMG